MKQGLPAKKDKNKNSTNLPIVARRFSTDRIRDSLTNSNNNNNNASSNNNNNASVDENNSNATLASKANTRASKS